ncbi:hypothetical protein Pelo_5047 [Pelomyxa schiedti]|nr:hypothetical protein Pelo_5047 [Pelomyxa schiedti]
MHVTNGKWFVLCSGTHIREEEDSKSHGTIHLFQIPRGKYTGLTKPTVVQLDISSLGRCWPIICSLEEDLMLLQCRLSRERFEFVLVDLAQTFAQKQLVKLSTTIPEQSGMRKQDRNLSADIFEGPDYIVLKKEGGNTHYFVMNQPGPNFPSYRVEEGTGKVTPTFPHNIRCNETARIVGLNTSELCLFKDAEFRSRDRDDLTAEDWDYDYKLWDVKDMTTAGRVKLVDGNACAEPSAGVFIESGLLFTSTDDDEINVVEQRTGTHVVTFRLRREMRALLDVFSGTEVETDADTGGPDDDPVLCFVVGPETLVNGLFASAASSCGSSIYLNESAPTSPIIIVNRCATAQPGQANCVSPEQTAAKNGSAKANGPWTGTDAQLKSIIGKSNKLTLWDHVAEGGRSGYIFYRYNTDNSIIKLAHRVHEEKKSTGKKVLIIFLYSVLHSESLESMSDMVKKLLPEHSIKQGPHDSPGATLLMVDCMLASPLRDPHRNALEAISVAFQFCAFKMLKWSPKDDPLDALLPALSEALQLGNEAMFVRQDLEKKNYLSRKPEPLPLLSTPSVTEVSTAGVTTAHMIMQLVHDYRPLISSFNVTMALSTWIKAKNWVAVGVACMARSLTVSEDIDLSQMSLKSVPDELKTLSCKTLDLSNNNIHKIPRWLAGMPNAILSSNQAVKTPAQEGALSRKLVLVGDSRVGKTTLLRCMIKSKKSLTTKHVPTGISVHHNLSFSSKTPPISWTVWDLGGDSLSPFHPWFLLSKSIFIVVFNFHKMYLNPSIRRWLNEITVARSRGDKLKRTVIPVATHMERAIDVLGEEHTYNILKSIFENPSVPWAFLLQLSDGKGWKCERTGMTPFPRGVAEFVSCLENEARNDDGTPGCTATTAPHSWIAFNTQLRKSMEVGGGGCATKKWIEFVEDARKCGVSGRTTEIEKCAHFLASIGTIIHFRYPFWLSPSNHPGAATPQAPFLSELVILEPRSFLTGLVADIRSAAQGKKRPNMRRTEDLAAILASFGIFEQLLANTAGAIEEQYFSLFPSLSQDASNRMAERFMRALTGTESPRKGKRSKKDPAVAIEGKMTGRTILLPLFPREVLIKAVSRLSSSLGPQWASQFCWHRGEFFLSHTCEHDGQDWEKLFLLMTCQNNVVSICMRSTCEEHWTLSQQRSFWSSLMGTLHHLCQLMFVRFEEENETPFPWVDDCVETFSCPHCLLRAYQSPEKWTSPEKLTALPRDMFSFAKSDILNAVKNGEAELTCGKEKSHQIRIDALAPDLVPVPFPELEIPPGLKKAIPTPSIPPRYKEIFGDELPEHMTLADLLTVLIEKGNGTTSVLDQVIPFRTRMKILKNVAEELHGLHNQNPPVVHSEICPGNIAILSLETDPFAKIRDSGRAVTLSLGCSRLPSSIEFSPDQLNFFAPEVLSHQFFDTKADVWSFGITAAALLAPLSRPYAHIITIPQHANKYIYTDYSSSPSPSSQLPSPSQASGTTGTTPISHNSGYRTGLCPTLVGRGVLAGDITPFPPTVAKFTTSVEADQQNRLRLQIMSVCLDPHPGLRPTIKALDTLCGYFSDIESSRGL